MTQVLRVKRDAGQRRPPLQCPARTGHGDRAPRTHGAPRAPSHHRCRQSAPRWEQVDGRVVLTEAQATRSRGSMAFVAGEPCRWNEADRLEPNGAKPGPAARDSLARGGLVQGKELALARGVPPGPELVAEPAGETDFVVPLAVQHDLRAVSD